MKLFRKAHLHFFFLLVLAGCHKSGGVGAVAIHAISPAGGRKNTALTITGENFSPTAAGNQVLINGHAAVVTAASVNSLTVTVPAKAGTGPVEVRTGNSTVKGPVFNYQFGYYNVTTIAGSSPGNRDGSGADAQFGVNLGIKVDGNGNIIVADADNNLIREVLQDGDVITLAGSSVAGYNDGAPRTAQFNKPLDVAVDKANNIYVADATNELIRELKWSPGGYSVTTFAGGYSNSDNVDGIGTNARFSYPRGLATDTVGHLYVTDWNDSRIRKISLSSTAVITIAGNGREGQQDGSGAAATFGDLRYFDAGPKGDYLLVGDYDIIRKLSGLVDAGSTTVSTEIGQNPGIYGFKDGSYAEAQLSRPGALAIDEPRGHVFITDQQSVIRMADTKTRTVKTIAGDPSKTTSEDGPLSTATFFGLTAIAVDKDGNLYVANKGRIRRIAYE